MKQKICFITGSRAEYGLLKPLIKALSDQGEYQLQCVVTGTHLTAEFGYTVEEIDPEPFSEIEYLEMLISSDTAVGITKSMGLVMISLGEILSRFKPNAIVILGDRFEMLAVASTAVIHKIPILHLHGGEITEGAFDDSIRHAITKLSNLHFTSTEEYRRRVIQLGEDPERVFNVGALGVDNIRSIKTLSRDEIERELGFTFGRKNALITYHPVTLSEVPAERQIAELLDALLAYEDLFCIFTKANADTQGRKINQILQNFVEKNPSKAVLFDSLGVLRYLSIMQLCDVVVGNSSSGIIEAPSLGKPVVNIGDRQQGRVRAESVIDVDCERKSIILALKKALSYEFSELASQEENPYGEGDTATKIVQILEDQLSGKLVRTAKRFWDLQWGIN